ncbi:thiamine pyrophosphate-binding protein [Arthrobacter hankyongi]|uniref:thiamine pyrophosphate-binding protein n=1 Tax=Arthrobacter hankyongi TaxID=2904801 RepID=UPI0027E1FD13|nr:thiamine pyrophosphate-binding protein [Arthrobacter hankyongi]
MSTVSERLAAAVAAHVTEVFALMGNGNAYFLDALAGTPVRITAVRHEAATVAAADACHRVSGRLAVATTTYGPGFTNALTPLAEAAQARTPLLLVTGDAPATGPRPWDVDQAGIAAALGVPTFVVDAAAPARTAVEAIHHALAHRTPVILAIPYDVANRPAGDESVPRLPALPAPLAPDAAAIANAAAILAAARRPLVLGGRGAKAAAGPLGELAGKLGALTAASAPARGLFAGRAYDLGVAGGFASEPSAALIRTADVVLVVGAGLNQFTTAFGQAFAAAARIIQVDITEAPTNRLVTDFVRADAALGCRRSPTLWQTTPRRPNPGTGPRPKPRTAGTSSSAIPVRTPVRTGGWIRAA